jgi:uncharacterized protein YjgD (DUF1641 family)
VSLVINQDKPLSHKDTRSQELNLSVSEILAPILGGAANASVEEKKSIANTLLDEVKSSITENILKNVFNPFGGFQ